MNQSINPRRAHRDPGQHAVAIADAVNTAWNQCNHSGRRDVALSVVAALSLIEQRDASGPDLTEQLRAHTAADFVETLREIYTAVINARPDLTHLVYPLMRWVFEEPEPALQRAAKSTADAALNAGQLALTGTERRFETDLLGMVLTLLKSDSAGKANAQIYTPTAVAEMMARITVPEEGASVCDPAVGTGGLLRAAAHAMREHGRDPATVAWYGADIDDLAIAACAVNSLLWQLGPRMLLCVANTLAEDEWAQHAQAQRDEILEIAATARRTKAMLNTIDHVQRLISSAGGPSDPASG